MKTLASVLLLFFSLCLQAQKSYVAHVSISKIFVGADSVVFKKPKNFVTAFGSRSDTIEVAAVKGTPVALVIDIRKTTLRNKQVKYEVGYAFFKKVFGKWELVKHFGYTDRYDLLQVPADAEKKFPKQEAREEYHCQFGYPSQFEAYFKMDVYKKN